MYSYGILLVGEAGYTMAIILYKLNKMRYNKALFIFTFLLISFGISAQDAASYEKSYKNGKDLYNLGKYALAMEALKPLTRQESGNPYQEHASFYFALAAFKEGQSNLAKDMFLQITQKHPNWVNLDEVYYWLSTIYFEQGAYDQALKASAKVKTKKRSEDLVEMKTHYLFAINDLERLKELLQQNPYDGEVANVLATKISERPASPPNTQLLDFLINEFKLDKEKYKSVGLEPSEKKSTYHVAVLFPFMEEELNKDVKANQFVLDTYNGIVIAVEELKNQGKNIELHAYDTKRDSLTTANILKLPEIRQMDLIVGPLYPIPSKLVSDFTYKHKINMLNPLSTNSEVIGGNPMSFLFMPTLETQAKAAAEYITENFSDNKSGIIIYGESQKDSILAHSYKEAVERKGFKILSMRKIDASKSRQLTKLLSNTPTTGSQIDSVKNKPGHLFVATSDELMVANVITALEMRGDKLPVIVTEDWLELKFVSFEQLERLQVKFIAPGYIDYDKEEVKEFRNAYAKKTNLLPSEYAYAGYDMMFYFGNLLFENGNYFQEAFNGEHFSAGKIFPGYLYNESNNNQYVPIVQFNNSTLELVNPKF